MNVAKQLQLRHLTRWRKVIAAVVGWAVLLTGVLASAVPAQAGAPGVTSWFDDFNDGNATDGSPMTWDPNPRVSLPAVGFAGEPFTGTYDASSGDYLLAGEDTQLFASEGLIQNDSELLIADASETDFFNGVSVRTRIKMEDLGGAGVTANGIFPTFVGYYGILRLSKDDTGNKFSSFEVGRIDPLNGFIKFVDESNPDDPNNPGTGLYPPQTPPEFAVNGDILVQLDVFNDQINFTVWSPDDPQPDPIITVSDNSGFPFLTDGSAGIAFVEDNINGLEQGTATFRWAKAASVPILDGDMDLNGRVDFDDIGAFVLGLTEPATYEATVGLLPVVMGDTDHDGDQDFDDISGLVSILTGAQVSGAVQGVPEPSSVLLLVVGLAGIVAGPRRRGHRQA